MTTSKEQAVAAAEARDTAEFDELYQRVEDAIAAQKGEHVAASVPTSGISSHIIQRIIKTYETVGWKCKLHYDQRDGDTLDLS